MAITRFKVTNSIGVSAVFTGPQLELIFFDVVNSDGLNLLDWANTAETGETLKSICKHTFEKI